jgi:hypothetical protein
LKPEVVWQNYPLSAEIYRYLYLCKWFSWAPPLNQNEILYEMASIPSLQNQIWITFTSQRNKWANAGPQLYQRWDHVTRRSKHPLLTGLIYCKPTFIATNLFYNSSMINWLTASKFRDPAFFIHIELQRSSVYRREISATTVTFSRTLQNFIARSWIKVGLQFIHVAL